MQIKAAEGVAVGWTRHRGNLRRILAGKSEKWRSTAATSRVAVGDISVRRRIRSKCNNVDLMNVTKAAAIGQNGNRSAVNQSAAK